MSPFTKGALGFLGCAGIFGVAYAIGKRAGREETLKEVEMEEKRAAVEAIPAPVAIHEVPAPQPVAIAAVEEEPPAGKEASAGQETVAERVRNKKRGFKNTLFGGANAIKDLLSDTDGKKLIVTIEDGDVVARLSQKGA